MGSGSHTGLGISDKDAAINFASAGMSAGALESRHSREAAEQQYKEEQARIAREKQLRQKNIGFLRAAFGIGDRPDAAANKTKLGDYLNNYYTAYLTHALKQIDDQYANVSRIGRQNLARVGQLGSGLDASSRNSNLSDYLRARSDAVTQAADARGALSGNLDTTRQNLETQIGAGTLVDPDFNSIISQNLSQIDAARRAIPANTVGNLFTTAGEEYRTGRIADASGSQGLSAFFGGGGGGGRIS